MLRKSLFQKELRFLGTSLQTNNKNLINTNERIEVTKWESALKELEQKDLIVDKSHKGEVFKISNLGYQIADMIKLYEK